MLHVVEKAKNKLLAQMFKETGIHVAKEIFIKNKERNKTTNLVVVIGLFKIGQHLGDDRALASYLLNKEANIQVWYERLGHIDIQKGKIS
jgi:hypothetical protein